MCRSKRLIGGIIVLLLSQSMVACFGEGESLALCIEQQLLQIEKLWEGGKTNEYYEKAWDVTRQISELALHTDADRVVSGFLVTLLSKSSLGTSGNEFGLLSMERLAHILMASDTVSVEERRDHVLLICLFMKSVREQRIKDFEWLPSYANVGPPPGVAGWSGMDPAALSDPDDRVLYEAVIQNNIRNIRINSRQATLSEMESLRPLVITYIIDTFRGHQYSSTLLDICKILLCVDEKERKEIDDQLAPASIPSDAQ